MYHFVKRGFDLVFVVVFLAMFWWIYLATWLIIKIVSPGPAIYRAQRVGRGGKVFTCYKFRSMRINSGKVRLTTLQNDNRIFPFGRFIRATKIDEFPQILNIFNGDMTVVGPRPEDIENARKIYVGPYCKILSVRPGLTSPASLYDYTHGELFEEENVYEKEFLPQKLVLELYYVNHQCLALDAMTILKTAYYIIAKTLGRKDFPIPKHVRSE